MPANIPLAVRTLIEQYRRFLRTSYRFLDEGLRSQFEEHLARADVVVRGPFITLAREFVRGRTLHQLVQEGAAERALLKANWAFGAEPLFGHQERALEVGRAGRSFAVTTGTGSGKTEAFLLPVIDGIVRRKREGVSGVQAVLLYPMNALANDQLERLRRLLAGDNVNVSFGLYTGDSETASKNLREEPPENERTTRAAIRRNPPDILLTNYKQLEFLLVRAEDRGLFTPSLRYLVLDEVHSYRGALATEISCLVRRLKAHAGLDVGKLLGIGTSATVAAREDGAAALAKFASTLFGETFREQDVIGESLVPVSDPAPAWVPAVPVLSDEDITSFSADNEDSVCRLAERLTGRACSSSGPIAERVAAALAGNRVVRTIEEGFSQPRSIQDGVRRLRDSIGERQDVSDETLRREVEAYLLVGSVGDEACPPRLRPKLHLFFHGIYDVALCLNPDCRALVPQGGSMCLKCGSQARPAALCRTCGQDFVKVRFVSQEDVHPVGTADFYSDDQTGFLTHRVLDLPENARGEDDAEEGEARPLARSGRSRRRDEADNGLERVAVCLGCGTLLPEGQECQQCARRPVSMLLHRGRLNTCPTCGDIFTRGDIVTPLRTGTASTVSVLTTHHLDPFRGEDRKLLVFADNRQDAAHQAGYTADKHRSFALRHLIAHEVTLAGPDEIHLTELRERLFDHYIALGIIPKRWTKPERERWLWVLEYEAASELTRYSRQRGSLENLGLVGVGYAFLDRVESNAEFQAAAREAGLDDLRLAVSLVRAILDVMRKNRAVAYDFFQEYVDPNQKRKFRELESEPYNVRFPDRDRGPKAFALDRPDHIRKAGRLLGFYQENPKAGQLTAVQKIVARLTGSRASAEQFIRAVVPILKDEDVLVAVPNFPIPKSERVAKLEALQIAPRVIQLVEARNGFRCNACQTWRPYELPTCPTPRCREGRLQPQALDCDNYYVRLYLDKPPQRMTVAEHSAQIGGDERAKRETEFKTGRLNVLVCTPTLELGVDIGPLLTVVLRNAPPTPANYAQRVGRAGRRLRIGFVSTFCAGGSHDRHAFEHPEWLVAGRFDPPAIRLDNRKIVERHLRSYLLESVSAQLPHRMGDLLDDIRVPTRWKAEDLGRLFGEVRARSEQLADSLAGLMAGDRLAGRVAQYGREEASALVDGFERAVSKAFEDWWERVRQLDREFREYSTVGSPRQDEKKAAARKRAYYEITQDPERAYVLNYLSTEGLLPAYQFPVDTFSLDPGVPDTPTLYRPAAIAIEEFAPGNYVYANGHKLRSIRVLFPGGPGQTGGRIGRSDAETSGRLHAFHFCDRCDEAVEAPRNECPRCGSPLPAAVDAVEVEAFEAEENLRIGSEEETRQRQYQVRRESLVIRSGIRSLLYPYPLSPVEYTEHGEILITNWGPGDPKSSEGRRFRLCPDCGRHQPYDPADPVHDRQVKAWNDQHAKYCQGQPVPLVLSYRFQTPALVLNVPTRGDAAVHGRKQFSPMAVTLGEALLAGAASLLELESGEMSTFVRRMPEGSPGEQIVFYETTPGGSGYLAELGSRLAEISAAAIEHLYEHRCAKACYLCLKHYGNQRWHQFLDKDVVRDVLFILSKQERVEPIEAVSGSGLQTLKDMLADRLRDARDAVESVPGAARYQRGAIEEPLLAALRRIEGLPEPNREYEFRDGECLVTVPDFAWEDRKVAVYCDGFAVHGNLDVLDLDARKRNLLQSRGWVVLTYWGRTILKHPDACARQIASIYTQRAR